MIRTLLLADDLETTRLLSSLVLASDEIKLERSAPVAPGTYQLTKALQTTPIDVVLLDASDTKKALQAYQHIREINAGLPVVTFSLNGQSLNTPFSLELPLSTAELMQTVRAAVHATTGCNQNVIAMIPAKGGCGATTTSINLAARLSGTFGKKVLVCEADLRSGVIADVLDLDTKASMQQTLQSSGDAQGLIWARHVSRKDDVDFILTRREQRNLTPRWHNYQQLIAFVSQRYDRVIFDLPEMIDDAAAEVVLTAKKVYLVTTAEIVSLKLAQGRVAELRSMGVEHSSLRVIVNRHHKTDVDPRHIEEILDCAIETVIPNNYPVVHSATRNRTFVDQHTDLGRSYEKFASAVVNGDKPVTAARKRSLFGFLRPGRAYEESLVVQRT